jgi:Lecithin:cholesterol acyltransferase
MSLTPIPRRGTRSLRRPSRTRRCIQTSICALPLLLWLALAIHSHTNRSICTAAVSADHNQENTETTLSPSDADPPTSRKSAPRNNQRNDELEDSFFDPIQADPDCDQSKESCGELPDTTMEEQEIIIDATCSYGGDDPDSHTKAAEGQEELPVCPAGSEGGKKVIVDKHWGSDPTILRMRDALRLAGTKQASSINKRPPIFLMPGLASTRLVAWSHKVCDHPLLSDIKVQDNVWLNINLVVQMGTIDVTCMRECLKLGMNQSDGDVPGGCKLRPDEGLDAISSLGYGIASSLLVGGTNTVYAWLIQWLADNLGYDVSNIVGLPYDWRLSPDKMEERDGFLTLTRRRIEAAVQSNEGKPGIMVAHSMGNAVFRYFLEWLRMRLREEAYQKYIKSAERRAKAMMKAAAAKSTLLKGTDDVSGTSPSSFLPGWMGGHVPGFDEWWSTHAAQGKVDMTKLPRHSQLWDLAQVEGDDNWIEWIETHIWTYVGLSAPMLGAVNPLRAVISGENMGMPITEEAARVMEVTFGSTHTVNPISSKEGFCDQWDAERWDEEPSYNSKSKRNADARLACLDDIYTEIEFSSNDHAKENPWKDYESLRVLLKERRDWDSDFPMIKVVKEYCEEKEKSPCARTVAQSLGPKQVQTGELFLNISKTWKEADDPLVIKREQLRESFWDSKVMNILNRTWERPLIKHVIMAYGVDVPTEVGYVYRKTVKAEEGGQSTRVDGIPSIDTVVWETPGGILEDERLDSGRNALAELLSKKPKRRNRRKGALPHSGDGSVPYLSLSWAHTWLLHAVRALRHSGKHEGPENPLIDVRISHRPKGAMEWLVGSPPDHEVVGEEKKVEDSSDTGTAHPHGTRYKPLMLRYDNRGTSRTTGIEYTTTVIEAVGVEHKETTR